MMVPRALTASHKGTLVCGFSHIWSDFHQAFQFSDIASQIKNVAAQTDEHTRAQ